MGKIWPGNLTTIEFVSKVRLEREREKREKCCFSIHFLVLKEERKRREKREKKERKERKREENEREKREKSENIFIFKKYFH